MSLPAAFPRIVPRIYAILDAQVIKDLALDLETAATGLVEAGIGLIQYRDKRPDRGAVESDARKVAEYLRGSPCRLILNDYADLVRDAGFDGVHVGQGDLEVCAARELVGDGRIVGVSTHTEAQMRLAAESSADYVAVGPVFRTSTKVDAEPVVGLEGVGRARALTGKPLVAIGGISASTVASVLRAGADSAAVIGALYRAGRSVKANALELLQAAEG